MKVEVRLNGVEGVLDTLKALPPEVVSKGGGPVRAALRKGAVLIQKQAKANFNSAVAEPGKTGITDSTGFTEKQIVTKRKTPRGGVKGERYIVTVNPKPHPSGTAFRRKSRANPNSKRKPRPRKTQTIQANDIAFIMEYGSSKQAATPWLRPAFEAKAAEAISTIERELVRGIDRIVRKLAKNTKGT